MSQLDVLSELRAARPTANAALRERVRAIAATTPEPQLRRRPTWRRAAFVLVPAALVAVAAGAVVLGRGGGGQTVQNGEVATGISRGAPAQVAPKAGAGAGTLRSAIAPAPSRTRLQDYDATLRLHVRNAEALSDATKRAVRVATSLGGFASAVQVDVGGRHGDATLRLRVPATKVQVALQRLSDLGTITGESVAIRDAQAGVNALDRRIARLQRQLRELRAKEQTPAVRRQVERLTAQVQRLQRGRADTVRQARLATIRLELTTRTPVAAPKPADHGPLHGAVVALRWLGIGLLYALVVGGPIVLLGALLWLAWRGYRRLAERRLLERA
jgi:hypothetical protein